MEQVWKCEFCHHFNVDAEEVKAHEKTCSFNPAVKACWSCKHNVDEGMPISGSMYVCQVDVGWDEKDDIESDGGCKKWEAEDES